MKHEVFTIMVCLLAFVIISCGSSRTPSELDMVFVEGGSMKLGNGSNQWPFHEMKMHSYYMSACEITNKQVADVFNWAQSKEYVTFSPTSVRLVPYFIWELIDLDHKNCQLLIEDNKLSPKPGKENYPVVQISWYGAVAFCNYLSEKEGRTPSYDLETWDLIEDRDGYYLPTTDEWEYASRGGAHSENSKYAGSDDPDSVAWYIENSEGTIHPVGLKKPNELGLYDMSGNVWEVCTDKFGLYYTFESDDSEPIAISGSLRIYRGGSFATDRCQVNSYVCSIDQPSYCWCFDDIGFRVVSRADYD